MSDDSSPKRVLHFPKHQPGATALRGRALKKAQVRKPSPSEYLVEVLERAELFHAVPPACPSKIDLSYFTSAKTPPRGENRTTVLHPTPRPSMQYFVAQYIELLCNTTQSRPGSVLIPEKVRSWIVSKGYAWEDLELWAKVLIAKSSDDAVSMLRGGSAKGPTPMWLILFLLRRERLTLGAYRYLLRFALGQVGVFEHPDGRNQIPKASDLDEKTVFILFIRLLRHARVLLPPAMVPLTKLVTAKINPRHIGTRRSEAPNYDQERMNDRRVKLAHVYNKALKLLSLPSTANPYASAVYQEKAQFEILRRIAEYEPPIPITEDGYRALIRTQLAHVKTDKERLWASLKSKGWPPWKEDRTAMDEDIHHEDAISRAGELLRKMEEAGYPATDFDQAASVLTGWDLDDSPTIQTRMIYYPRLANARDRKRISANIQHSPHRAFLDPAIWAARIQSTRTLEEAWACFLAYESSSSPQHQRVYFEVFQKIVADRKQRRRQDDDMPIHGPGWKEPVPGDSPDVWPIPKSYRDRIDPTLQIPDTKALFDRMLSNGLAPGLLCLEFLVKTAANYEEASHIIAHLHHSFPSVHFLLRQNLTLEEADMIPDQIFKAYILLLTRLWYRPVPFDQEQSTHYQPLLIHRALKFLSVKRSKDRQCWYSVLLALSQYGMSNLMDMSTVIIRDAIETMKLLEIDLDQESFSIVCKAFYMRAIEREDNIKARYEALQTSTAVEDVLKLAKGIRTEWDHHLEQCSADSRYLRTLFNHLVGTEPQKSDEALAGIQVPIPHIMHRYIQALGIMFDYEGLLSVAEFLKSNASILIFNSNYAINGRLRLRLALVSLRVHLEYREYVHYKKSKTRGSAPNSSPDTKTWASFQHYFEANPAAKALLAMPRHSEEQVALARLKLDHADARELGGWPSDEEVEHYLLSLSVRLTQPPSAAESDAEAKPLYPNLT